MADEEKKCDEKKRWRDGRAHISLAGPFWIMGWLFTIGYLAPSFWKGVLAIILWPYYLGVAVR
jgi:hypothetical protein